MPYLGPLTPSMGCKKGIAKIQAISTWSWCLWVPVGLGVLLSSLSNSSFLPKITVLMVIPALENTSWPWPPHFLSPSPGRAPRDSFPHYFNPLLAFNLFSRAVSTTVARCQERKSRHSWMVGPSQCNYQSSATSTCLFLPCDYILGETFSWWKLVLLNAACRARFMLADVPAFLCIHAAESTRPENTLMNSS